MTDTPAEMSPARRLRNIIGGSGIFPARRVRRDERHFTTSAADGQQG